MTNPTTHIETQTPDLTISAEERRIMSEVLVILKDPTIVSKVRYERIKKLFLENNQPQLVVEEGILRIKRQRFAIRLVKNSRTAGERMLIQIEQDPTERWPRRMKNWENLKSVIGKIEAFYNLGEKPVAKKPAKRSGRKGRQQEDKNLREALGIILGSAVLSDEQKLKAVVLLSKLD